MNNETPAVTPQADAAPSGARPAAPPLRTRNQSRASAMADGLALRAKWKAALPEARSAWPKLGAEELVQVAGNFHRLAGLVQLRQQLSREESDRQVRTFFDKHLLSV
jgi:hypothetical protein